MKRWILLVLSINQLCLATICTVPKHSNPKFFCNFEWTENNITKGVQLNWLNKSCMQREGGELVDCITTQTCEAKEQDRSYGTAIYRIPAVLNMLCAFGNHYLLGNEDKNDHSLKVFLHCKNKQPQYFMIKTKTGASKRCPFPAAFLK